MNIGLSLVGLTFISLWFLRFEFCHGYPMESLVQYESPRTDVKFPRHDYLLFIRLRRTVSEVPRNAADGENDELVLEQTLVMIEQMTASLERLQKEWRRKAQENAAADSSYRSRSDRMPVGGSLLQQLDTLELMMQRRRQTQRMERIRALRQRLNELG